MGIAILFALEKIKSTFEKKMKFRHFLVLFSILCSGIAAALNGEQNDEECPRNWVKIGTGCYLFAIPEILEIDNACKLDGCTKEEAINYCAMKHGYLVEYQLVEEFEMVRAM